MTFLAPFAALIATALALPALLVLYLLKLRRRPVRVGFIRFWPKATEDVQANVPLRMIRPSWLLLLHLVILALLIGALGRPSMHAAGIQGERGVLLIDVSASMSAIDDPLTPGAPPGPTRLARAKDRAKALIAELRRGAAQDIAIIVFAADARLVSGFTGSRSALEQAIDGIEPTDQPGNLAAAIRLLDTLTADDDETRSPPDAVLISDGSFRDQDRLPPSSMRLRFERIGPAVATQTVGPTGGPVGEPVDEPVASPAGGGAPVNLGIVAIAARRDGRQERTARIFVEVVSNAPTAQATALALSINGVVQVRRSLEIPAANPGGIQRAGTTFELDLPEGGLAMVSLTGTDALASDNSAAVDIPPASRPLVVLVQPDSDVAREGSNASIAAWLLADALTELRLRRLEAIGESAWAARQAGEDRPDVVIFDRVAPRTLPRVPSLHFGAVPRIAGVGGATLLSPGAEASGAASDVVYWSRSSPLLQSVSLDALTVRRARLIEGAPSGGASGAFTELLRLREGVGGAVVTDGGVRRVIIGFDLADSNWPVLASFPVFLADVVDELTQRSRSDNGRSFTTGAPVTVRVGAGGGRVVLRGPVTITVREETRAAAGSTPGEGAAPGAGLSVGLVPRAGVYLVEGARAAEGVDRVIAVNLADDVESALQSPPVVEVAGRAMQGVTASPAPREVWHWFVLAAFVLLAVEWAVYGRAVRA